MTIDPDSVIDPAALALIKEFEGFEAEAYQDVGGRWTIGYGEAIDVSPGDRVSEPEAEQLLLQRIRDEFGPAVDRRIKVALGSRQRGAIISWMYNLGSGRSATFLQMINDQATEADIRGQWERWNKVRIGGQFEVVKGLVRRRKAEMDLFFSEPWPFPDAGSELQALKIQAAEISRRIWGALESGDGGELEIIPAMAALAEVQQRLAGYLMEAE